MNISTKKKKSRYLSNCFPYNCDSAIVHYHFFLLFHVFTGCWWLSVFMAHSETLIPLVNRTITIVFIVRRLIIVLFRLSFLFAVLRIPYTRLVRCLYISNLPPLLTCARFSRLLRSRSTVARSAHHRFRPGWGFPPPCDRRRWWGRRRLGRRPVAAVELVRISFARPLPPRLVVQRSCAVLLCLFFCKAFFFFCLALVGVGRPAGRPVSASRQCSLRLFATAGDSVRSCAAVLLLAEPNL